MEDRTFYKLTNLIREQQKKKITQRKVGVVFLFIFLIEQFVCGAGSCPDDNIISFCVGSEPVTRLLTLQNCLQKAANCSGKN